MSQQRVSYHGTGGDLFILFLKNFFLTIITLGIYSFWAKTNVQKYMASSTEWEGERFSFHGSGKERFIGFLKAMAIVIVIVILNLIVSYILGLVLPNYGGIISSLLSLAVFIAVIPFILVGKKRFFLSRTGYRNLRFGFDGKSLELTKLFLVNVPLVIITLGIYYPFFAIKLETFYRNNSRYGNANFQFSANEKEFFWLCVKGSLLSIITIGIYGAWFVASLQNFKYSATSFQGKKFSSDLTGGNLFLTFIKAYFLAIFTLGIGFAWSINMVTKLLLESVSLDANVDFASITAKPDTTANATTEGLEAIAETLEGFLG